jgi:acyl-CoA synthetase (AMP-forming)/AMP-acid ligase II
MTSADRLHGWTVVTDEAALEPGVLDRAWSSPASLLLAPMRRGVDVAWFERALSVVPAAFSVGHYALLTSGSTGEPKLIVGARARTERLAGVIHAAQQNAPVERAVVLLPLTYSYAFVNQWVWAQVHGRRVELTRGAAELSRLLDLLRDGPPAMVCLVGPLFTLLAQALPKGAQLDAVVRVNFAGGAFPHGQLEAVRAVFPNAEVFNNYGCAEALPRLTITPAAALEGPGDVGVPLPGVALRVEQDGELRFQSDYGALGVVEAGAWRPVGPGDWLGTQDLAEASGGRFRLLGRRSEVYKRYGEKISTAQQLQAVREVWPGQAATVPARDAQGEAGHVLVLSPPPTDAQVRAVLKVFRARFPRAHWPLRVESTGELPVSANGKLDAAALAAGQRQVHWQQPA